MIKKLSWLIFGFSFLLSFYLFVLLLNAGVEIDDARTQSLRYRERSDLALKILRNDWLGKKITAVSGLAKELEQQGVVVGTEEDSFEIGDFIFETKNGLVTDVHYMK